jgi:hypothetical protein
LGNEEDQVEYTVQFLVETKKEEVVEWTSNKKRR